MTDVVERLREWRQSGALLPGEARLVGEAIDEIERLRDRDTEAEEVFAKLWSNPNIRHEIRMASLAVTADEYMKKVLDP